MKKTVLALGALSILVFTSCTPRKNPDPSQKEEKSYKTEVTSDEWNEELTNQKALDPFANCTINVKNGGKLAFGNSESDLTIKISNGYVYIKASSKYVYYVATSETTGVYNIEQYEGYTNTETGEVIWEQEASGEIDSLAFIAFYATPAMRIQNLIYNDFTYNEETKRYELESLTTKGYWFPNDPDYLLNNINVSFRDGKLYYLNYFISQYNTEVTSTFSDYGITEVPSIESLMQ